MLTTLIYQSKINKQNSNHDLETLFRKSNEHNLINKITGILLFNGTEFFQIIEGEEEVVDALFTRINNDPCHMGVVELIRDYSAYRRFSDTGMTVFNLQKINTTNLIDEIRHMNKSYNINLPDDRVFRLIKRFIEKGGWYSSATDSDPSQWNMVSNKSTRRLTLPSENSNAYTFAFQPIVEPMSGHISSFEALIRDSAGRSPEELFASIHPELLYEFDLNSKSIALEQAGYLLRADEKISINLLPGSLYSIPGSVALLLEQIEKSHLRPEQVIIEIIETELITKIDDFHNTLKDIRVAGIGLAIDDFGSGFSRLSLLSKIQPDKIKIDRSLIVDIHKNLAKQAMVVSIMRYCEDLGINLVVEGVEKIEEWCWLQSIGIKLFQGFLFSKPCLNGIGEIYFPVKVN